MDKYERKSTVAFDPGRRTPDGIGVAVKLPPAVFQRTLKLRRLLGASSFKEVIRAALDRHVETLRLLQEGYRIFAAPEDFTARNTVPITLDLSAGGEGDLSTEEVITELQLGFDADDLRCVAEIQEVLGVGAGDVSTPVIQALLAAFWMADKQQHGYPSIHAVKDAPPRCAELKFDRETFLIRGG